MASVSVDDAHHPKGVGGIISIVLMLVAIPLGNPDSPWHWVQLGCLIALLASWGQVCHRLMSPTELQKQERIARMHKAVDRSVVVGLNESWYRSISSSAHQFAQKLSLVGLALLVLFAMRSFPSSIYSTLGDGMTRLWTALRLHHSEPALFLGACVGTHLVIFWTVGLVSAVLEFARPACLEPFKVQQDAPRLTAKRFAQGCLLALLNQFTLVVAALLTCPFIADRAFAPDLPTLPVALMQLACCIPVSEVLFYTGHRLLHMPWAYDHIHYIHHSWEAPIAIASIYAHPAEFILANIPVVLGGPLLVAPHLVVWFTWCCAATLLILSGHLGWHLPFGSPSPEAHDFHHSHGGGRNLNNLGQIGVLDAYFCTEKDWLVAWQRSTDKAYWGADYPVDKALAFPHCLDAAPMPLSKTSVRSPQRGLIAMRAIVWAVSLLAICGGAAMCGPTMSTHSQTKEIAPLRQESVTILDLLRHYNRSQAESAQALCASPLASATEDMMHAGFLAAAPYASSPSQMPQGCYFLCIAGTAMRPLPKAANKIPWDGKCFHGNRSLVNKFGQAGHACASQVDGLKATYSRGSAWDDPTGGGAVVIEYHAPLAQMRDEVRDAGDAIGYRELRNTWLGRFYLAELHVLDFILMPVQCDSRRINR